MLGVFISSDLSWKKKTDYVTKRGFSKLWIIRRLKHICANVYELLDIYKKQVRTILEFAVPVWAGQISKEESRRLEIVQKSALKIILEEKYESYGKALEYVRLDKLEDRRKILAFNFAKNAQKHPKFKHWFQENNLIDRTRSQKLQFLPVKGNKKALKKSPIGYMTELLNNYNK